MTTEYLINKVFQFAISGGSLTIIWKVYKAWSTREERRAEAYAEAAKTQAEAEKVKAEAEARRVKTSQELLNGVMDQLRDVQKQKSDMSLKMLEMERNHSKDIMDAQKALSDEALSCAKAMTELRDSLMEQISHLQHQLNIKNGN
ncbi:MAG TPA: hypothetical protein VEA37_02610 [Flavobacterium sp.]|nr:hypothetical protein [Flavobacterium sp.]